MEKAIEQQQVQYVDYSQGWAAYVLATAHTPTAVLWQGGPLLWLHLPVSPARVLTPYYEAIACMVQMAREESLKYFGAEPFLIGVSFTKQQIDWLFQNVNACAIAFAHYPGIIDNHFPKDKLVQFVNNHTLVFQKVMRQDPFKDAQVVFTDGSSKGTGVYIIQGQSQVLHMPPASAQIVKLRAVAAVF